MKRIFTLLSLLFMGLSVFAADAKPKSTLTVTSLDRGSIRVVLDGRRFEPGMSSIMISGIDAGYHNIKVYRERTNGFFAILGKRYEMIYSTQVAVRPKTNLAITIDRLGRTTINETRMGRGDFDRDQDWGRGDRDRDDHFDNRDDDQRGNRSYDYDRDGRYGDDDAGSGYNNVMSDRDFNRLLQSINTEWLESNKLKSVTQVLSTNMVTTLQVKQLMRLFSFENNKVEVAKKAYLNTVDKNNFFAVNEEFSFNSSRDELARFIRSCR